MIVVIIMIMETMMMMMAIIKPIRRILHFNNLVLIHLKVSVFYMVSVLINSVSFLRSLTYINSIPQIVIFN